MPAARSECGRYEMANAMMELQNPHRDVLHFTKAVNIFCYRNVTPHPAPPLHGRYMAVTWQLHDRNVTPQLGFEPLGCGRRPPRSARRVLCQYCGGDVTVM